ncbi:Isochorismatase-like protein [Rhypophila decipiens]|uniref:Isochorismatase-like protein n=1 Tax=Rhypophila decipiens TaxID=261697 RepID=A0AAN7B636_9PEZI|nr:Isochorismatase-like protein [Rhypophila decipiens]
MSAPPNEAPHATEARRHNGTALFIIDIQKDLALNEATQIPHAERVKSATTAILASARRLLVRTTTTNDIIVFVQHHEPLERGPLQKSTTAWELVFEPTEEGLRSGREIVVEKDTRDTFESNPHLAPELKARGISEIVACGIQSECCVQSTCLGALTAGFVVTLLQGAHSTYDVGDESAVEIEREVEALVVENGGRVLDWKSVSAFWDYGSLPVVERGLSLASFQF